MKTYLKAVRERCSDLRQEDVAAMMGVSLSAYQKWEQGARALNSDNLVKLSGILGVTVDSILGTAYSEVQCDDALSDDEAALIDAYRSLCEGDRATVLDVMTRLAGHGA